MNKELKYGIIGLGMALVFVLLLKLSSDGISFIASQPKEIKPSKDTIISNPVIVIPNQRGKKLFAENCMSCHRIHPDGPDIAHVRDRVPNCDVLYEWVRNSQKVIESRDPYFLNLYEAYNKTGMYSFPNLTDQDIEDILDYVDDASGPNYH